jgi:hypothetical protein
VRGLLGRGEVQGVLAGVQVGAELRELRAVAAHPVALTVDLQHGRVMVESVEDPLPTI